MVVVAVAGGTGAVGRTLVDALVSSGNHKVFVLTRLATGTPVDGRVTGLAVDYDDFDQITRALRENEVEAVVSALLLISEAPFRSQINLIRAASESGTVTKFIPTEYHIDFEKPIDGVDILFRPYQLESVRELERHSRLRWTLIRNGLFMDYLGMPFCTTRTHLMPWCIFLDLAHQACVFPGDGEQAMVFTHSTDLAAYVERLVGAPAADWPREALVMSCRIQIKDLERIAREVTGCDFTVTYDPPEAVRSGQITQLPSNGQLFSDPSWGSVYRQVEQEVMGTLLSGGYDLGGKNLADMFPDVQRTDLVTFLRQSWSHREGELA